MEAPSVRDALRGDNASTAARLAPGLMHIENMSLQSLARSNRGVGVNDLRDALGHLWRAAAHGRRGGGEVGVCGGEVGDETRAAEEVKAGGRG